MSKYEQMLAETKKTYATRIAAMMRNGKTADEAKAAIKAASERSFIAASARTKCGITNRPATIGEILAAKAR